ncbi:MAG: fructosamine kinase family protein [Acidimicrobiales bacterium]
MSSIRHELGRAGRAGDIAAVQGLSNGLVSDVWLVTYRDGSRVVAKTSLGAPSTLLAVEAEGLDALRKSGPVGTVGVLGLTEHLLVLEPLAPRDDSPEAWQGFAHDLAGLHHGTANDRFGWHGDGYLGWLRQENTWAEDGCSFFAHHRLLRYLDEPLVQKALEPSDRRALERFCDRLPEIVPKMPAVLTHGDLWSGNMLSGRDGRLVLIDPAVSYTWAEVDLSMLWCAPRPAASGHFFARYQELNPSPPGWVERMPLLHLREVLSCIAHFGDRTEDIGYLRRTLAPFYLKGTAATPAPPPAPPTGTGPGDGP